MVSTAEILKGRILIVDDKRPMVVLLGRILKSGGFDSVTSTTEPSLVGKLQRKHDFHLILLDIEMPEMDGFQVLEELKGAFQDDMPPIIVISAHQGQKMQAFQAGARDFIGKPFELPEVLVRVRNMLEIRLLQLETQRHIKALEDRVREAEHQITEHSR